MEIEIEYKGKAPAKQLVLPSGLEVAIFNGKAKDMLAAKRAAKDSNGKLDEDKMLLSLMSQLCKFNNKENWAPEQIEEMDLKDFTELMSVFADFLS